LRAVRRDFARVPQQARALHKLGGVCCCLDLVSALANSTRAAPEASNLPAQARSARIDPQRVFQVLGEQVLYDNLIQFHWFLHVCSHYNQLTFAALESMTACEEQRVAPFRCSTLSRIELFQPLSRADRLRREPYRLPLMTASDAMLSLRPASPPQARSNS